MSYLSFSISDINMSDCYIHRIIIDVLQSSRVRRIQENVLSNLKEKVRKRFLLYSNNFINTICIKKFKKQQKNCLSLCSNLIPLTVEIKSEKSGL